MVRLITHYSFLEQIKKGARPSSKFSHRSTLFFVVRVILSKMQKRLKFSSRVFNSVHVDVDLLILDVGEKLSKVSGKAGRDKEPAGQLVLHKEFLGRVRGSSGQKWRCLRKKEHKRRAIKLTRSSGIVKVGYAMSRLWSVFLLLVKFKYKPTSRHVDNAVNIQFPLQRLFGNIRQVKLGSRLGHHTRCWIKMDRSPDG